MATTTAQHIAARSDADLLTRFIAKAEMMGIANPNAWVQTHLPELITQEAADGQTITDVYSYAAQVRNDHIAATPPSPGLNPSAVTDAYLAAAITALQSEQNPSGV